VVPSFSNYSCIPTREPSGWKQNSITLRVENWPFMEKHLNTVLQSHP